MSQRPRGQYESQMQGMKEASVRPADEGWPKSQHEHTEAPSVCPMIPRCTHACACAHTCTSATSMANWLPNYSEIMKYLKLTNFCAYKTRFIPTQYIKSILSMQNKTIFQLGRN